MHQSVRVGGAGRCWGQLSRDHPKQGANSQLEGSRRRHVALTDQILQIAQGRTGCPLADGRRNISPAEMEPPLLLLLTSPCKTPHSARPEHSQSLHLTVFLSPAGLLCRVPGDVKKSYSLHVGPWTWTSAKISLTLLPRSATITDCRCFSYFLLYGPKQILNGHDGYCMCSFAGSSPSVTAF